MAAIRVVQEAIDKVIDVIAVRVAEMRIVEVIGVSIVVHCHMAAAVAMGMWMICMDFMFSFHKLPPAEGGFLRRHRPAHHG